MSWRVVVTGTIDLDEVHTQAGWWTGLQGGSAVYSALAANRFVGDVRVVATVGTDGLESLKSAIAKSTVDISQVAVGDGPTRRWRAVYDLVAGATEASTVTEGDTTWRPRLTGATADVEVLFVGSMEVAMQRAAITASSSRLIGLDSMLDFIDKDRVALVGLARIADVLFATREELSALGGQPTRDWVSTSRQLIAGARLRAVVVKAGRAGAACVTATRVIERPADHVATVVDPTGAGDALAGGFLGSCARAKRIDEAYFPTALADGMRSAALAISAVGCAGLSGPSESTTRQGK